jgi:ornithine cyclodeaminase/alanine dehydrogenase-like protein (mu-crystallin family)
MLVLNGDDVASVLTMENCIAAMTEALSGLANGTCWQPPRVQLRFDAAPSLMGLMPSYRTGAAPRWGLKHILVAPGNRARGLDSHQGAVLLNDGETGRLLAVIDATAITAIRTAAVSAVATKALARPDAACIAIIGTGVQARAHVEAMRTILPSVPIVIGARNAEGCEMFAQQVGVDAAPTIQAAVADADVICTATSARSPILFQEWIKPGCHINAIGTSEPSSREIGGALVAASEFFIDSWAQAQIECGEYLLALQEGEIDGGHVRAELGEVLTGRHPGRSGPGSITLFKSLGLAVEDLAAAELAVRCAREQGRGVELPW